MEISEIIISNKLIHAFMKMNSGWAFHESEIEKKPHLYPSRDSFVKFHSDWNWLMPVVEKIESIEENDRNIKFSIIKCTPYRVDILGRNVVEVLAFGEDCICLINEDGLSKKEAVYKAVKGFHYCFAGYSNWDDIEDEKFHELRMAYLDSARALEKYINEKAK